MTDNLPAVRTPNEIQVADTDSWIQVVGNVAALAERIADTAFVPKGLRGSVPATAAAILYGREVGLPPMTSLTQIHVIEGKPATSAEAMRAMVYAAGHDLQVVESNVQRCTMRGRRRGSDEWSNDVVWDMAMVPASLKHKDNWKNYPRQMLQARATAELCRLLFPDVIHGFRAVEEYDEEGPAEGSGPSTVVAGAAGTVQRRTRKSAGTKGEATIEAPKQRPALAGPPLPGEAGYDETPGAGEPVGEAGDPVSGQDTGAGSEAVLPAPAETPLPEDAPDLPVRGDGGDTAEEPTHEESSAPPRPATKADLRMYHAAWNPLLAPLATQGEKDTVRLTLTARIIRRDLDTSNNLTQAEARQVADTCARCKSVDELVELLDAIEFGDQS